ncbi:MAG: glycosyltransferase [Clostridia bacterium]|nr:glycosyltransferase [Clostridia bacterium]
MKTLILTVTAGYGHNSTAAAVKTAFSQNGNECKIVDICYENNKAIGFIIDKGYLASVKLLKKPYSVVYTKLLEREAGKKDVTVRLASYLSKKYKEQLLEYAPDVVVCTHVLAAMVIKPFILSGELNAKTIGILTDFTLHPYWEEATAIDYIVIPSEKLADECIAKGYKPEQILPIGVPIQQKFSNVLTKSEAREQIGLMPDKPVITVMSGSMCYGGLTNTVKALDKINSCFQIVAVCGSSKKELKKLEREHFKHKVIKLGFTDKINIIMDASDCIITKPGGLSVSESLSRELPMILSHPIPGHEERNLRFIVDNGAAIEISKDKKVDEAVKDFLTNSNLRASLAHSASLLGKKNAAEKLFEVACK